MPDWVAGLLILTTWWLVFWLLVWWVRRLFRKPGPARVSGNGMAWEQDYPWPECFDNYDEGESDL